VAELNDASIPRLATGCRWGGTLEAPVVLFPEGAIKVEGTGRAIMELCAGQLTLLQIVQKLEQQFILAPPGKIRTDVIAFIEQLHAKRIIDYGDAADEAQLKIDSPRPENGNVPLTERRDPKIDLSS
jgi:coenzyme PQQ biosynthesis protein PqqD